MKLIYNNSDITQLVTQVKWSGDIKQVARKIEFGIANSPTDYYLPKIAIALGKPVSLYEDDRLLFFGIVFSKDSTYNSGEMSITAYDYGIYLNKSNCVYRFKDITPENAVRKICTDFSISIGDLAETGINIQTSTGGGDSTGSSVIELINRVYRYAGKQNGKKYRAIMKADKLSVIESGIVIPEFLLENEINISNSNYSESLDSMVNSIVVLDKQDEVIDTISNDEWIMNYGKFQDMYRENEDINYRTAAQNMLMGIEQRGGIEALGNTQCIAGYSVRIKDTYTGLIGIFEIQSDSHTWQNGMYSMTLDLNFEGRFEDDE